MEFQYSETAGNENPKYGILAKYTGGINTMFFAHNNVFKPMEKYADSRIPRYFDPGHDGVFRALDTRQDAKMTKTETFTHRLSVPIYIEKIVRMFFIPIRNNYFWNQKCMPVVSV